MGWSRNWRLGQSLPSALRDERLSPTKLQLASRRASGKNWSAPATKLTIQVPCKRSISLAPMLTLVSSSPTKPTATSSSERSRISHEHMRRLIVASEVSNDGANLVPPRGPDGGHILVSVG